MKKTVVLLLACLLLCMVTALADVDISNMSVDELLVYRSQIDEALINAAENKAEEFLSIQEQIDDALLDKAENSIDELLVFRRQIDEALIQASENLDHSNNNYNGLIYVSNGEEIRINMYKGNDKHVSIPSQIDGIPVTMIADRAFENAKIESISLPDTIVSIGEYAFSSSKINGIVVLPKSLKEIGSSAFVHSDIKGAVIQSNFEMNFVFSNAFDFQFLYITEGVTSSIGRYSFSYNNDLEIAVIPSSITNIEKGAFAGANKLTIVTPAGSYAETYAKENWILCNTEEYNQYVDKFNAYLQ